MTKIGIGVTTYQRPEILERCLKQIEVYSRDFDYALYVHDDSETAKGVARSKNACIEHLMDLDCEHIFLFDDDCWPISDNWAEAYISAGEPHLMYLFKDLDPRRNGQKLTTPPTVWSNGRVWAQHWPRGCMMYLHHSVIERVGGMRKEFGRWGHEHVEYSWRVHNAGLTTAPFMDVVGSDMLIYSLDEHIYSDNLPKGFDRTIPYALRTAAVVTNQRILQKYAYTDDFVEYRTLGNTVLSALLTTKPDPQREGHMTPDYSNIQLWVESIQGAQRVILADAGVSFPSGYTEVGLTITATRSDWMAYGQRWISYLQWLRKNPRDWVWITDATDVEMLQEPWPYMEPGTLYVGYEPTTLGCLWMLDKHPGYREWILENSSRQLFNAGVVGGDYKTVLRFVSDMVRELFEHAALHGEPESDMASFNKVVSHWQASEKPVKWGSRWTTVFKAEERNTWSIWKHK